MPASTMAHTEARRHAEAQQMLRLPIRGVVRQTLPELEAVDVQMALEPGITRLKVRHPYFGPNSWIRTMPEAGTELLTLQRGDDVLNEIFGYDSFWADNNIVEYKRGNQLFRTLRAGEMELMSTGRAYIFLGESGDLETRGGTIRHELLQSKLELNSMAPTHIRKLHTSPPYTLANEERYGVVKRPDTIFRNSMEQYIKLPTTDFAVEYSRWLNTKDGQLIMELQEGSVVDALGIFTKQGSTSKDLRYHKKIQHRAAGFLVHQVDEDLNILFSNTSTAAETKVDLGSKNVLRITAQDVKANILKTGSYIYATSLTTTAPNTKFKASTLFLVESPKSHLKSPMTHFGTSPSLPIALANPTVTTFSTVIGALQGLSTALGTMFPPSNPIGVASKAADGALAGALASISQIISKEVMASG